MQIKTLNDLHTIKLMLIPILLSIPNLTPEICWKPGIDEIFILFLCSEFKLENVIFADFMPHSI